MIVCGLIIISLPVLGIPNDWKTIITYGTGVLLVLLGYSLRHSLFIRSIEREDGERATDSFVESTGTSPRVEVE